MSVSLTIERVSNGYIVNRSGTVGVYKTTEEVLEEVLAHCEGRSRRFLGESYGAITIHRKPPLAAGEAQP